MIINMECLLGMSTCLADNSIDAVVTDPPYGLSKEPDMMEVMKHWMNGDDYVHPGGGFMGKSWDSFVPGPAIWKEVFRVLKPGGYLVAFFGSRTYDIGTLAIRLAGFEIRDQIMWVYGSGFPKSLNVEKATGNPRYEGWGTALKPAHEPICVARKPLCGTVAENVLTHGTGAVNIAGCRIEGRERTDYGLANSSRSQGSTYSAPSQSADFDSRKGRWPANFVHDGLNAEEWSRFFYCAKASKADRDEGVSLAATSAADMVERDADSAGMNSPRAGAGRTSGARNDHPTVKPTALMQWLVRLVTPPGGKVLDPFAGSGSTGKACAIEGFEFIGFEMDPHYCEIAEQRIKART
ncbi:MAG: DNA methylase [Siphoviridae sp. ctdc_1]|nr:MAG: DNA methylase [Siphoviridae sp. ctdc_1]